MLGIDAPLGVFDSGVGGLTVLSALQKALPFENFIYLGDTARVPYGGKPLEMVRAFSLEISYELLRRGVKGIVVACNTAAAASLPGLASALPVPVWGVIEPGVEAARRVVAEGRVGVLGTVGTLRSGAYQRGLEAAGLEVWAKACPLFVPIVEEGVADGAIAKLVAEHYLGDRPALSAVILGCTHYPALKSVLREVLGPTVSLLDSAEETASVVARDLRTLSLARPATSASLGAVRHPVHHLVSGDVPSYLHIAEILGGPAGTVERVHWRGPHAEGEGAVSMFNPATAPNLLNSFEKS